MGDDVGKYVGSSVGPLTPMKGAAEGLILGIFEVGTLEGWAVGLTEGSTDGGAVGFTDKIADDGFAVGLNVAASLVGSAVGFVEGWAVGLTEGSTDGGAVGFTDGIVDDGFAVGAKVAANLVGNAEGFFDFERVGGEVEGIAVGSGDGIIEDGFTVGAMDCFVDGLLDGCDDGDFVGEMEPVSVKQSGGFKQYFVPLQVPLQQLASTNIEQSKLIGLYRG